MEVCILILIIFLIIYVIIYLKNIDFNRKEKYSNNINNDTVINKKYKDNIAIAIGDTAILDDNGIDNAINNDSFIKSNNSLKNNNNNNKETQQDINNISKLDIENTKIGGDYERKMEIDFVDLINKVKGRAPISMYDTTINFKTNMKTTDSKIECGRSGEELLEAVLSLKSLLNCEFNKLDNNTQINYLYYKYFKTDDEDKKQYFDIIKKRDENLFIESLPYGDNCSNKENDEKCKKWAENGECVINPSMMLYDCEKSCRACNLSNDNKQKIIKIIESRSPLGCVYHDE